MSASLANALAVIDRTICGHTIVVPINAQSPEWLILANLALLSIIPAITLGTIVAAIYFLIHPGEQNPNHPKYRILSADR